MWSTLQYLPSPLRQGMEIPVSIFESNRTSVWSMTVNCIWWCSSSPGTLENVEYLFNSIVPRISLTRNGCYCMGSVKGSNMVSTTVRSQHLDKTKCLEKKVNINILGCCFEQILETALYKTAVVRPLPSHLTYPLRWHMNIRVLFNAKCIRVERE